MDVLYTLINSSIAYLRSSSSITISRLPLYIKVSIKVSIKVFTGDALECFIGPADILRVKAVVSGNK